jgi:hypothetical protein
VKVEVSIEGDYQQRPKQHKPAVSVDFHWLKNFCPRRTTKSSPLNLSQVASGPTPPSPAFSFEEISHPDCDSYLGPPSRHPKLSSLAETSSVLSVPLANFITPDGRGSGFAPGVVPAKASKSSSTPRKRSMSMSHTSKHAHGRSQSPPDTMPKPPLTARRFRFSPWLPNEVNESLRVGSVKETTSISGSSNSSSTPAVSPEYHAPFPGGFVYSRARGSFDGHQAPHPMQQGFCHPQYNAARPDPMGPCHLCPSGSMAPYNCAAALAPATLPMFYHVPGQGMHCPVIPEIEARRERPVKRRR